jgi:hypothetical protein
MGEVVDLVEENFVNVTRDIIDIICEGDPRLMQAIAESYVVWQTGTLQDRNASYNKIIEVKTAILKEYKDKLRSV